MYAVGAGSARPNKCVYAILGRADPVPTVDVSLIDAFPLCCVRMQSFHILGADCADYTDLYCCVIA